MLNTVTKVTGSFSLWGVEWAETVLVLANEFRGRNVYSSHGIKEIVDQAYDVLPLRSWQVRVRSDSAAYQQDVLDHWQRR